jgi:ubiquinone/menaquinone biosynthesis C-methylase UbiE
MTRRARTACVLSSASIWTAIERRVALPPERWLRVALAADAIERFAGGRRLAVLDAGSGDAPLARLLAEAHPQWEVVAGDRDEGGLERARRAADDQGIGNLELRVLDLCRPFDENRFDVIAAVEVLTEIEDDDAALRCMAQALARGGLLVVTSMDRDWTPVLHGSSPTWVREVRHGYTRAELVEKVEQAGLAVMRARPVYRTAVRLAEEISDRVRGSRLRVRAPLYPILRACAALERRGLAAGAARGWLVEARRP